MGRRQQGVTMIEMVIVIAIIGILLAISARSFVTWTQNLQIRTAAEGILAGYNIAKNEAVRRNTNVEMTLNNTSWDVHLASDPATSLQSRDGSEGSANALVTITPGGSATVTFTGMGRVASINADGSPPVTQVDVTNPVIPNPADARNLRVQVSTGGAIRLCDPIVAAGDNRACK